MLVRRFHPLLVLALLFASLAPAAAAQEPLPPRPDGRIGWPVPMTPRQHVAASTFFGGMMGAMGGGLAGLVMSHAVCPDARREWFTCRGQPTVLPEVGVTLGYGTGAYLSARSAAVEAGCDPADARRRANRGALRGFIAGAAPLLLYNAFGGADERVEWTLAFGGSAYQAASITQATWGCLGVR